jgi:putative inorganic carbon (hco3(-)) transporter
MTAAIKKVTIVTIALIPSIIVALFGKFNFNTLLLFLLISLVSLAVICSLNGYRILMALTILSLPLSINLSIPGTQSSIIFPTELFLATLGASFFLRLIFINEPFCFSRKFLFHPVSILIYAYFVFLFIAGIFSTLPAVSWKSLIVKFSYIIVFYFMMNDFLKSSENNLKIYYIYSLGLFSVVAYTLYNQSSLGFNKYNALLSVVPFFNDHTMYSAALAFVLPSIIAVCVYKKQFFESNFTSLVNFLILILFLAGIYFSYCRAAWLSVLTAFIFFVLMLGGLRFSGFIFLLIAIIAVVFINRIELLDSFRQNKVDSNVRNAGLYEQAHSITNITNDASNAERLNRWNSALRMFNDKPFFGFGPGTYQFQYLTYQRKEQMTRISVTNAYNTEQGRGGTAHSEYFLTLSESGIFSLIAFLGILFASVFTGIKLFTQAIDKKTKIICSVALIGLVTYFTHGLFNNFLDNAKLAFLFWSSLSLLATYDTTSTY